MALNRRLTPIVAGRTVKSASQNENMLSIIFSDGSEMKIKGTAEPGDRFVDRIVKTIRQKGNELHLDFTDSTSLEVSLAEPTSSVMLRDETGKLEYAD